MSDALKASLLYTVLTVGLLVGVHFALPGHVGDGWTAFLMLGAFIFVGTLWSYVGAKGWPSKYPSPWHE